MFNKSGGVKMFEGKEKKEREKKIDVNKVLINGKPKVNLDGEIIEVESLLDAIDNTLQKFYKLSSPERKLLLCAISDEYERLIKCKK
jgi:hypothetical protein